MPRMMPITDHLFRQMYASINNSSYTSYPSATSHPQYFDNLPQIANSIEFTDLTHPQLEDRRRRRSNTMDDKESVSNMRIVSFPIQPLIARLPLANILQRRRAQNRASQRAFRERKEKHVQHLERELEELETKYRNLSRSYTDLDSTHSKLKQEVDQLRDALKSSRQGSANSEPLQPPGNNFFDPFATDNFFGSEPHLRF